MTGDPFKDNSLQLLGAVYDTMGADFLREGLLGRNVSEEEVEQIISELEQERPPTEMTPKEEE